MFRVVVLFVLNTLGFTQFLQKRQDPTPPNLTYWHSYVAADGLVYFATCNFSNFSTNSIGPGVVPSWHETLPLGDGVKAVVATFPVGHLSPWHVDPKVQFIQVLEGEVEWELSGGEKKTFVAGQIYVEEDHLAENSTGKLGHQTRNVHTGESKFLMLQTLWTPTREQPCHFDQPTSTTTSTSAAISEIVSGFADTVEYKFSDEDAAAHFLDLMQPFANYVRDNEQDFTHTFRTFLKDDNKSVLILERFVNKSSHDGPHLGSAAHNSFSQTVNDWNASTGAITGKLRNYWYETEFGTFLHGDNGESQVSGFADSVVYSFGTKEDAQTYLSFLKPFGEYVKVNEASTTYTFRPFLSENGLDVLLFERFAHKSDHDGPHKTSAAHDEYAEKVDSWNSTTGAIVGKEHVDWYETDQGIIGRGDVPLAFHWWLESGSAPAASTVCSSSSGLCHAFGHFVFLASPTSQDPTLPLDGIARFGIDGGAMLAGPAPIFEKHLVTGICVGADHSDCSDYGPSQVHQLNKLAVYAMEVDATGKLVPPATLPKTICAEVDMFEANNPSKKIHAPQVCADFTEPVVLDDQADGISTELNAFSTVATSVCNDERCQNDFHVMFFVANSNPTHVLEAVGKYTTDAWQTETFGVGIYEQHVNLRSDGVWKQAWQFNAEFMTKDVMDSEICYSITVKDTVTQETGTLDNCITPCRVLVPFHNAAGYCPEAIEI